MMIHEKKKGRMMLAAVMAMVVRYSTRKHLKLFFQEPVNKNCILA